MAQFSATSRQYQAVKVLKCDATGEPITYQAVEQTSGQLAVVKRLPVAPALMSAAGARRWRRLMQLRHPGVARYYGVKSWHQHWYLIREYVAAESLAEQAYLSPNEVKAIACQVLMILQALQHLIPPLVHGNLKPENIFLCPQAQGPPTVLLTDLADWLSPPDRLGFTPPEQAWDRPTAAADNYALGATLLSCLSGTPADQMDLLTAPDDPYHYPVRTCLAAVSADWTPRFLDWLAQMVAVAPEARLPDARTAWQLLQPLAVIARPQVRLSHSALYLRATHWGEPVQAVLRVSNWMPDTRLRGRWQVTLPPGDPGHWLTLTPAEVKGNDAKLLISVDTRQLQADQTYVRELVLRSNSERAAIAIPLCVCTGDIHRPTPSLPLGQLLLLLLVSSCLSITVILALPHLLTS